MTHLHLNESNLSISRRRQVRCAFATLAVIFALLLVPCRRAAAQPNITITPTTLTWENVLVGSGSATQWISVENTGNAGANDVTFSLSSGNTGDFNFAPSGTCVKGQFLGAGASCTIGFSFEPTAAGLRSALMTTTYTYHSTQYNAPNVTDSGNGVEPNAVIYVDSLHGNDSWTGEISSPNSSGTDGPLYSFQGTVTTVRRLVCVGGAQPCSPLNGSNGGLQSVTVEFEVGNNNIYPVPVPTSDNLTGGIQLTDLDSGSSSIPITYTAATGATPIISGGVIIPPNESWTQGSSGAYQLTSNQWSSLSLTINQYFEQIWAQTNGSTYRRYMVTSPTTPVNNGSSTGYFYNDGPVYVTANGKSHNACGANMSDPDQGAYYIPIGNNYLCTNVFFVKARDIYGSPAGGTIHPSAIVSNGGNYPVEVVSFENWSISRMRAQSLTALNGSTLQQYLAQNPVDLDDSFLTVDGPTIGATYWGYIQGHRYLLDNIQDLLSSSTQGNFFVTQNTQTGSTGQPTALQYAINTSNNENLTTSTSIIVPQSNALITVNPAHGYGFHNVTFENLTFSYANWTAANPLNTNTSTGVGYVGYSGFFSSEDQNNTQYPQTGSNIVVSPYVQDSMPAAVTFNNSSNITLSNNTFIHDAGWGVDFIGADPQNNSFSGCTTSGGSACNNQIKSNYFGDLGGGAIRVGQLPQVCDNVSQGCPQGYNETLVTNNNYIYNNVLYSGDRELPGDALFVGNSNSNVVYKNTIYDFYNVGINVGHSLNYDGCGGFQTSGALIQCTEESSTTSLGSNQVYGNQILNNLVYKLGEGITSDMGGVHMANGSRGGNVIEDNVFHDITQGVEDIYDSNNQTDPTPLDYGYGGWGIYLDQASSYETITNNLVYNTSASGFTFNPTNYQNSGDRVANVDSSLNTSDIFNNIFAFGSVGSLHVNGNDYPFFVNTSGNPDFKMYQDIFYWDDNSAGQSVSDSVISSPMYGPWQCTTGTNGTGTALTLSTCFALQGNMYYSSNATYTNNSNCDNNHSAADTWCFYYGTNDPNVNGSNGYFSLATWQSNNLTQEDAGSFVNTNPGFINAAGYNFGFQSYAIAPKQPPNGIGFSPFTFSAGSSLTRPTALVSPFTLQTSVWTSQFLY